MRRLLDIAVAALGLLLLAPVLALAMVLIRRASPGPALYRARRCGVGGAPFTLFKLRTMHAGPGPRITGADDPRLFPLGERLRRCKLDEAPQLLNILRGDMALVGPRPEDSQIVADHYDATGWRTLSVRPGLTSPGTLFYYAAEPLFLEAPDIEAVYSKHLLPIKLALDAAWMPRASLLYDIDLLLRTAVAMLLKAAGRELPLPRECAMLGLDRTRLAARLRSAVIPGASPPAP